jgi:DNA-binding transcriptional ArsR family regulator
MRQEKQPRTEDLVITDVLSALGDPVRFAIVKHLYENKCSLNCTQAIAPFANIAKSTLSGHFRVLRESGLVNVRKQGVENINTIRIDDINSRFPNLLKSILSNDCSISE